MTHYLLVFDRPRGKLLRKEEFSDARAALHARFREERAYAGSPDIEVVVLGAVSEAVLHRTHARYFQTFGELLQSATDRLALAR